MRQTVYQASGVRDMLLSRRGPASLLGHASLNTVLIYTEPTEEDLLRRVERMGGAEA